MLLLHKFFKQILRKKKIPMTFEYLIWMTWWNTNIPKTVNRLDNKKVLSWINQIVFKHFVIVLVDIIKINSGIRIHFWSQVFFMKNIWMILTLTSGYIFNVLILNTTFSRMKKYFTVYIFGEHYINIIIYILN